MMATVAMLCIAVVGSAQAPGSRHPRGLLGQFVGHWELSGEVIAPASGQVFPVTGKASVRMLGESWLVSDVEFSMAGMHVTGLTTIGYNPAADASVQLDDGTWMRVVNWEYRRSK